MSTTTESVVTVSPNTSTTLLAADAGRIGLYIQNRGTARLKMSPSATAQTSSNLGITLWPKEGKDVTRGYPLAGGTAGNYVGVWTCWNYGPGSVDIYIQEVVT